MVSASVSKLTEKQMIVQYRFFFHFTAWIDFFLKCTKLLAFLYCLKLRIKKRTKLSVTLYFIQSTLDKAKCVLELTWLSTVWKLFKLWTDRASSVERRAEHQTSNVSIRLDILHLYRWCCLLFRLEMDPPPPFWSGRWSGKCILMRLGVFIPLHRSYT